MHAVVEAGRLVRAHSALEDRGWSQGAGLILAAGTHPVGYRGRTGGRGQAVCTTEEERERAQERGRQS